MNTRTHTLPAGTMDKAAKGTSFYCPIDTLTDKFEVHPKIGGAVISSMAWMLDAACVNQAKTVMFERYSERLEHDETFDEFLTHVHADLHHVSLYEDDSNERTLAILLGMRESWHDAAYTAVEADGKTYEPKRMSQMAAPEKKAELTDGEIANIRRDAIKASSGDADREKRMYDAMIAATKQDAEDTFASAQKIKPTIMEILRTVGQYAVEGARFDMLPDASQKRLITFALGAVEREQAKMRRVMKKTPLAYAHLSDAAFEATRELEYVLRTKFNDASELENTRTLSGVELEHQRQQKRAAIATID